MKATRSHSRLRWVPLVLALLVPLTGCEDDTTPVITRLDAFPVCDVMTDHPAPQAGVYLDVNFFARASSGNRFDDPTGANSPLEWRWNFGDGGTASNVVNPVHRYTAAGTYEVTLTVEDEDGQKTSRTITVFVGEQYTDLDIVLVEADLVSTAPVFRELASGLRQFDGWNATYAGSISSNCDITGLFQQYLWAWDFGDGGTQLHLDGPTHLYAPTAGTYTARLTVTEQSSGVARSDSVDVVNPAGMLVPRSTAILIPGESTSIRVTAYLLHGMTELETTLSYDTEYLDLDSATDVGELAGDGFTTTIDTAVDGVVTIRFAGGSVPSDSPRLSWGLADLAFTTADPDFLEPSPPNWNLEPHERRLMGVGVQSLRVVGSGVDIVSGSGNGGVRVESDCNQNGVADSVDLATNRLFFDQNLNGIIDACE